MTILSLIIFSLLLYKVAIAQPDACINTIKEDNFRFHKSSVFVGSAAKKKLNNIANVLKLNPACRIIVTGYGNNCITCQQTSWDRT